MKKNSFLLFLLCCSGLFAQQSSRYNQAAAEFGLDNPAGLSLEEMRYRGMVANAYVRNQWWDLGTPGNPQAQTLTLLDNHSEKYLVGGALISDRIGETRQFGLQGRYAHKLAEGLKLGLSAGFFSHRIFTENLDQRDLDDPLAATAGDTRWRLSTGAGAFYNFIQPNSAWRWFAGVSFRHVFFISKLPGEGAGPPAETDLLAQGGLGIGDWRAGGRLRHSLHQPSALDLYLRRYLFDEQFFLAGILTSDEKHRTAGGQAGFEWKLGKGGKDNHFLTVGLGFGKPLSKYIEGSNLIFDTQVTWAWER